MGILVELSVMDPIPASNTSAVPNQSQQCFWGGAQAGEKQMLHLKRVAVAVAAGRNFHDPTDADSDLPDVLRVRRVQAMLHPWLIS